MAPSAEAISSLNVRYTVPPPPAPVLYIKRYSFILLTTGYIPNVHNAATIARAGISDVHVRAIDQEWVGRREYGLDHSVCYR